MTIQEIKRKSAPIFDRSGVEFAGIFGSFARGDAQSDSDVDMVVRFKEQKGLFDFFCPPRRA